MKNYKLTFENYYTSISSGLINFQQNEEFVDMTLAADGHLVKVHRNVVSLASPYIKEMIKIAPCSHPVVYLSNIKYNILCVLLEYIYTGEVDVPDNIFSQFVEAAKALHIVGFIGSTKPSVGVQNQELPQKKNISQPHFTNINPPIDNKPEDVTSSHDFYATAEPMNNDLYPTTQNLNFLDLSKPSHEQSNTTVYLQDYAAPRTDDVNIVNNVNIETVNMADLETRNQEISFNQQFLQFAEQNTNILPISIADENISIQQDTYCNIEEVNLDTNEIEPYDPTIHNENQNAFQNNQKNEDDFEIRLNYSSKDVAPGTSTFDNITENKKEISINVSEIVKSRKGSKSEIILGKPMFSISIRGQLQLIFNRFIYYIINTTKKAKRKFRCIDYKDKKCPAFIVMEHGLITQRKNMHCHAFHDRKIEQKIEAQLLYENIEEANNAINIRQHEQKKYEE